jgi:hypothetical protein
MPDIAEELFREDGHLSDEGVAHYAELLVHSKTDRLKKGILAHVESCFDCKKRILSISDILSKDMMVNQNISTPDKLISIKRKRITFNGASYYFVRLAAILILGLGIYFVISRHFSKNIEQKDPAFQAKNSADSTINISSAVTMQKDVIKPGSVFKEGNKVTTHEPDDNKMLAENFTNNKNFDELMNSTMRSGIAFKVLKPSNLQQFKPGQSIEMRWKTESKGPFIIIFFTNLGKEILRSKSIETTYYKADFSLTPGLYYWELTTEEDLLYIGKLLIE